MLDKIIKKFNTYNFYPKIGVEIEFYLVNIHILPEIENFITNLQVSIRISKEEGENQYELMIPPSSDIESYINLVDFLRNYLESKGAILKVIPFPQLPPNALHLHINLIDNKNNNLFVRQGNNYNLILQYSIAGLCDLMQESIIFMLPNAEDYLRLVNYPPNNVSWGANNRTTVLRLPENIPQNLRIEYRIISPEVNLKEIISIILLGIYHGIKNKLPLPEKIYGLAHKQSKLAKLPTSLLGAEQLYTQSSKLKNYLESVESGSNFSSTK